MAGHPAAPSDLRCVGQHDPTQGAENPSRSYFTSAQWSPDGTCILTNSADRKLRTFIVQPDLLDESRQEPHKLAPYSTSPASGEPIRSTAAYPRFNLSEPATTLVASGLNDHPIQLRNALDYSYKHASYPLLRLDGETFRTAHALTFSPSGKHLVASSTNIIAIYDVSRDGQQPAHYFPTVPFRRANVSSGAVGMKGIVSALAISPTTGLLAAGTFTRCVGLYDQEGRGNAVTHFSLRDEELEPTASVDYEANAGIDVGRSRYQSIGGAGVTQVLWSPCGRYLYVLERKSDGILVYDVRVFWRKLGLLTGRDSRGTNQRMDASLFTNVADGGVPDHGGGEAAREIEHELWAGTATGKVVKWSNPHLTEGLRSPDAELQLAHDTVSSAALHPRSGSVLLTASGSRDDNAPPGRGPGMGMGRRIAGAAGVTVSFRSDSKIGHSRSASQIDAPRQAEREGESITESESSEDEDEDADTATEEAEDTGDSTSDDEDSDEEAEGEEINGSRMSEASRTSSRAPTSPSPSTPHSGAISAPSRPKDASFSSAKVKEYSLKLWAMS